MLKKNHALKVIIVFSGVIVLGLVSLVIIDSFNAKEEIADETSIPIVDAAAQTPQTPTVKTLPTNTNNQNKAGTQKARVR